MFDFDELDNKSPVSGVKMVGRCSNCKVLVHYSLYRVGWYNPMLKATR